MATGRSDRTPADYYDVLGVPDTASSDDIVRAYRRLAREHHPDRNPVGGSARFQEVRHAYDVIGDPERRRAYDATRAGSIPAGARRIPVNYRSPATGSARKSDGPVIRLTARESVLGTTAAIDVVENRGCSECGGQGLLEPPPGDCRACGGTGSLVRRTGQIPVRHVCRECAGRGRATARACTACGAAGVVASRRRLKVRIPPGVRDGDTLRIRRKPPATDIYAPVEVRPDL
jgi:molecular chaperone DnaJ